MVLCLMVGCGNKTGKRSKKEAENGKFYRVPRVITTQGELVEDLSSARRRQWISAISRADLTEEKIDNDRVCSKHFISGQPAKDWDRFNVDWTPTLNLGHSKTKQPDMKVERAERRKRRQETIEKNILLKLQRISDPGETVEEIFDEDLLRDSSIQQNLEKQDGGDAVMTDLLDEESSYNGQSQPETISAQTETIDAETQTSGAPTTSEIAVQTDEFDFMFATTKVQPFTEDYFKDCEDKVRFYTGLTGFDVLKYVHKFVSPQVRRKSKTLTSFHELVLVLMKLRLNVPKQDLAYRFDISLSTVSRIFSYWMMVLDARLSPLISWPEREELWRTMPMCFRYSFGTKTTIIIDCFEIFIERPSNLLARAQTFSHYKHHNTVKVLIGITPQGSICFVSKAWGGRISDKFLTERCGLLENLKPGDLVMADRGFTIEENLALHQAKLAIPVFTKGKSQLDPLSVEKTRGIANVRIHVERVIGLLRQKYTILQSTLPIDYLMSTRSSSCPLVDRMVRVCCALTNLCPSVVPFD